MLKKIHWKLSLLFFSVTALIMLSLSLLCLHLSEQNLLRNSFSAFSSQVNLLHSDFRTSTLFTADWLTAAEENGKYIIHLQDNGTDFFWGTQNTSPSRTLLIKEIYDYCSDTLCQIPKYTPFWHTEFFYPKARSDGNDYFVSIAVSTRQENHLLMFFLMPLSKLNAQIMHQRILLLLSVIFFCSILFLFSHAFTWQLLKPIQKSQDAQTAFIAAASHELRTPLSVILSAASSCRVAPQEQISHFLSLISQETEQMSYLINDLLTLSGSTLTPAELTVCEADTLLLDIFEVHEQLVSDSGHILQIKLPDKKITPIRCDYKRIRQVFSILISNALCHTQAQSRITLSLDCKDSIMIFYVSDNGPGIPDAEKENIFHSFYRLDPARSQDGHYGLGLSIAVRLMESMGGQLSVTDTPGGGATFFLTVPCKIPR